MERIFRFIYFSMIPVLALSLCACTTEKTVYLESETSEAIVQEAATTMPDAEQEPALCCVYVCGAVNVPGVYELSGGSRICDAIEAAGGMRQDAAPECMNQAEEIADGQMIQILTVEEMTERSASTEGMGTGTDADGRVDLNTASAEQLMTLPGIGQAKADAIIAYRESNGKFRAIEDIKNIPGIKDGVFFKIKDSISVS